RVPRRVETPSPTATPAENAVRGSRNTSSPRNSTAGSPAHISCHLLLQDGSKFGWPLAGFTTVVRNMPVPEIQDRLQRIRKPAPRLPAGVRLQLARVRNIERLIARPHLAVDQFQRLAGQRGNLLQHLDHR